MKELYELITPVGENLLVCKPRGASYPTVRKTEAGIYLPQQSEYSSRERALVCKIFKRGEEVKKEWQDGDSVILAAFSGIPVYTQAEQTEVWLINQSDILAKVDSSYWEIINESGDDE